MRCFYHPEVDAIGLCTACARGLCAACAVDMDRGLACKERCEHEVRRLLDLRDFSFAQPHQQEANIKRFSRHRIRGTILNLVIAMVFFVTWYFSGRIAFLAISGAALFGALLTWFWAQPSVRTDQFRLCPRCGYNITGNTSGKCPECGYLV